MLKAIIFDFWGTLVETGTSSPIRQVKDILRLRLSFPAYVTRMEEAMRALLSDEQLSSRLSSCGPRQAARFSWDRCGEQTIEVLRQAAEKRP